ncbi:MAG: biotin--[acetyl-CoA-carboxylase] ligase [Candidatus Thermoplasmatota archaeon]
MNNVGDFTELEFRKKAREFPKGVFQQLIFLPVVSSTNVFLKEGLKRRTLPMGTVVVAAEQTHGRGRFDRVWFSPKGGLYCSLSLRPKTVVKNTSLIPLFTALAVVKTLLKFQIHSLIKWPNDVHIHGRKIAGILLESEVENNAVNYVIVGVGINVNISTFPDTLKVPATSLLQQLQKPVSLVSVFSEFIECFHHYYTLFLQEKYNEILYEWKLNSDTIGKHLVVRSGALEIDGVAVDVDDFGFLLVQTPDGIMKVSSGDCEYLDGL